MTLTAVYVRHVKGGSVKEKTMTVKSDFIRAVVEEGISAARKYFGSSVEKTIKETKKGKEQLEKAQQRFKDKKKPATKKKKVVRRKKK